MVFQPSQNAPDSTRRVFLAAAGSLGVGGLAYWLLRRFSAKPASKSPLSKPPSRTSVPQAVLNKPLTAQLIKRFEYRMQNPLPATVIPEYERTAEHVLVDFYNFGVIGQEQEYGKRYLGELAEILMALPDYTTIHLRVDSFLANNAREAFSSFPSLKERVIFFEPHTAAYTVSKNRSDAALLKQRKAWAQDLCETARTPDGRDILLVPLYRGYTYDVSSALLETHFPTLKSAGFLSELQPVVYDGGNVLFDRVHGRNWLFVGATDIIDTLRFYRTVLGVPLSYPDARTLFKNSFGADEVRVFGLNAAELEQVIAGTVRVPAKFKEKEFYSLDALARNFPDEPLAQSPAFYHLDFLLLPEPTGISVAAPQLYTAADEKELAKKTKATGLASSSMLPVPVDDYLESIRFETAFALQDAEKARKLLVHAYTTEKIRSLNLPWEMLIRQQSPLNTILYTPRADAAGQPAATAALVPLFPTLRRWVSLHTSTISDYLGTSAVYNTGRQQKYAHTGANAATVRHFESRYPSRFINDYFHPDRGSVHCVVNVLS